MRFGAAFWINRTSWPDLASLPGGRGAGWDSLWIDDHLLADEGDPTDPKFEGWATLSALAVLTERVRLGLLVAANTFRSPGLTAKLATTLDHLSGGRASWASVAAGSSGSTTPSGIDFGAASASDSTGSTRRPGSSGGCSTARLSTTTAASTRCTTRSACRGPSRRDCRS